MAAPRDDEIEALTRRVEALEAKPPQKAPPVVTLTSLLNLLIALTYALAEACGGGRHRQVGGFPGP